MNDIALIRLDKSAFSIASLHDEGDEKKYWARQSPQARLRATELLRQLNYGYDPATARLQRVLEVVERKPS
jgi:hypothetical protein